MCVFWMVEMLHGLAGLKALLQTTDAPYRKPVIHSNKARTPLDPEYRAHETALQRKCRQEAKASSK